MMGSSDDETTRLWKATKLIVEANSYERMTLLEGWVNKAEWQQHLQGRLVVAAAHHHTFFLVVSTYWIPSSRILAS